MFALAIPALISIAGTLFSAYGARKAAKRERAALEERARGNEQMGEEARAVGRLRAGRLRKVGRTEVSSLVAADARAGVDVGSGSSAEVRAELARRVELDALSTILEGDLQGEAYSREAALNRMGSASAGAAGRFAVGQSLLAGAARVYSGSFGIGGSSGISTRGPSTVNAGNY